MKLSEVKTKPPKILIFGNYGSGKTLFAMTGGKYVQLIDLDEGVKSGKTFQDNFTNIRKEVDILQCYESEPKRALAFMKAQSYIQSVSEQCSVKKYPFKILVIDSLTNLHEYCMRMILANSGLLGQKPRIQDWMLRDIQFLNLFLIVKSLPIAVVVLAHQQIHLQDDTNIITPHLPGKSLPNNLISKFDEVLYIKSKLIAGGKTEYNIQNISTTSINVRTRANFKNNLNVNVGLLKLLELMDYNVKE